MRRTILTLLTMVILEGAAWLPNQVLAQQTPLNFVIISRYYDGTYATAPVGEVRHVYFTGEPIDVVLDIGNAGDEDESIDTSSTSISDAFNLVARRAPSRGVARLEMSSSAEVISAENQAVVNWGTSSGSARVLASSGKVAQLVHRHPAFTSGTLNSRGFGHRGQ